jgi:importin subunit beta-1
LINDLFVVLGLHFLKYIDHVLPFLYEALNNHSEYQICAAAVGVVGDLSRSLHEKLTPYCDQIMTHLLTCLNVSFH